MPMPYTTLISAAELTQNLATPDWVILDCRHDLASPAAGLSAFNAGHIPHAQFVHLDNDLSGPKIGPDGQFLGRHPLPQRDVFIDTLRDWGINDSTQVVTYDAQGGIFAARLWWMLRWVGHEAVAVLDGGFPAWAQLHEVPLSAEHAAILRGTITDRAPIVSTVSAADLLANLASAERTVLDARAPDRFRGENETLDAVGGHIPGAKNRFFRDNLQADGCFKPAAQLRAEFGALISDPQATVSQCGSGVTACHNLLAMEIAGLSGAALYPGSWSEWCADPARPVATGS